MSRQRAVRQQLEDLQRAGVTHIPADVAQKLLAALPQKTVVTPTTARAATVTRNASSTPPQTAAVRRAATAASFARPTEVAPVPVVNAPGSTMTIRAGCTLTRDERIAQLRDVASRVSVCARCEELARTRTRTVFGVGNPEAAIMLIGEAPGAEEDRQGEPFVGEAGQLLNKIIVACQLTREELYICNVLRCRPPGNRTPTPIEAQHCREYLDAQIATVSPQWIVCLGAVAAQTLLNSKLAIGKLRGVFHDYKGIKVLCTYHPSYLLRYEPAKKDVWADMKMLRAAQGVVLK